MLRIEDVESLKDMFVDTKVKKDIVISFLQV